VKKQLLTSLAVLILGSSVAFASPQEWQQRDRYDSYTYARHGDYQRAEHIRFARLRRMEELRRLRRLREEQRWREYHRWDRR